jgi:hypothetical protein
MKVRRRVNIPNVLAPSANDAPPVLDARFDTVGGLPLLVNGRPVLVVYEPARVDDAGVVDLATQGPWMVMPECASLFRLVFADPAEREQLVASGYEAMLE